MNEKAWASWAVLISAVGNALAGLAGALPASESFALSTGIIAVGAIGKALYAFGTGLSAAGSSSAGAEFLGLAPGETFLPNDTMQDFEDFRPPELGAPS